MEGKFLLLQVIKHLLVRYIPLMHNNHDDDDDDDALLLLLKYNFAIEKP